MEAVVYLSKRALKNIRKLPRPILVNFDLWVEIIENEGLEAIQSIRGYRDHSLVGKRKGQRSSSLSRSWRVVYRLGQENNLTIVEVLEIHHHEY